MASDLARLPSASITVKVTVVNVISPRWFNWRKSSEPDGPLKALERGKVTLKRTVSLSFGMNTRRPDKQCGRLTIDGEKKPKMRSCKNVPKNHGSVKEEVLVASLETGLGDELENQTTVFPNRKLKPHKKGMRIKIVEKNRAKTKERTQNPRTRKNSPRLRYNQKTFEKHF